MRPNFGSSHTFSLTATAKSWASLFVLPCLPECYLQSETKIEPDLRLQEYHRNREKNLRVYMVFGDVVTKLQTFVWIFNHVSRVIT